MQNNVGGYDRIARFILGPILIIVGAAALGGLLTLAAGTLGLVLAGIAVFVGAVLTVTATTRKCPLNAAIGLNTYKERSAQHSSTDESGSSIK
ncbi:YgaP family membrane protein [Halobacteriaceae archaeon SHR40]|uniref:YgaP family membrane protein n=1 Tax=Halovenus amylolytica TaxID=2500550 RepID=UPI000FE391D1